MGQEEGAPHQLRFQKVTYEEAPSGNPQPPYDKVVSIYKGPDKIITLDPVKVVSSDAPGDCSSNLTIEPVPLCTGTLCVACYVKAAE